MKERTIHHVFKLLILLFAALGTYLLLFMLHYPYIGVSVEKANNNEWIVTNVEDVSWAKAVGIQPGDTVLSIDDTNPDTHRAVKSFRKVEQVKTIVVKRHGQSKRYTVPNHPLPEQLFYHTVFPGFIFILCLGLSLFLYRQKKEDKATLVLISFLLIIGTIYLNAGASARMNNISLSIGVALIFIPILFLHFIEAYFKQFDIFITSRRLVPVLYFIYSLLFATDIVLLNTGNPFLFNLATVTELLFFSMSTLLCLYVLASSYIRYQKTAYRPVFKILVTGIFFAFFPFVAFVALPRIILGTALIPAETAALFLILIPIVFLYLILANRFLDIDFVMSRIRYYALLAIFPSLLCVLFLLYTDRIGFAPARWVQLSMFVYVLFIAFLYVKEELDYLLRSRLYTQKYNYQASLIKFSQDVSHIVKVSVLEERLLDEINRMLSIKAVSLFKIKKQESSVEVRKGDGLIPVEAISEHFKNYAGIPTIGDYVQFETGMCFIIGQSTDDLYGLWIGEKLNHTSLNHEEKEWLITISNYVGIVYENLHLMEGLMEEIEGMSRQSRIPPWILRLLFSLQEKERRRLAADLHDSALQEQVIWYRKLEVLLENRRIPEGLKGEIVEIKEGLLDVIHEIRETCNELRPPFIKEMGVAEALENLFASAQLRNDYIINFHSSKFNQVLNDEYTLVIYRIVQELLTNAAKHSKATEINIILSSWADAIYLNYQDNGVGMDVENIRSSFQHIGLSGIKERVRSLEGDISFHSSPDQGLEVSLSIPLRFLGDATNQVV
ncbi:ATP-binding protein [Aneurinibacillus tyrosinisolvens]|uniref:ATP-binding protein n=1 Tax=Aneurinibacillus tyrosinisolvens TaxID=1443435 RepID=UPI00063F72DA|nr:ATP-binding protein [Aneurinibacillus tyrosinisolvens]